MRVSLVAAALLFLAVSALTLGAAAGSSAHLSHKAGYRQWSGGDCKGLVNQNDAYCKTGDCKAAVSHNDAYCKTGDCRAYVNDNDAYCETGSCKALVNGNEAYCP